MLHMNYKYGIDYIFVQRKGYVKDLTCIVGNGIVKYFEDKGFIVIEDGIWKITFLGEEEYYNIFKWYDKRKWWEKYPKKFFYFIAKSFN